MSRVPEAGDFLSTEDVEMIFEAVRVRQTNFDEPAGLSILVVMLNIGDRFAPVECIEQEWQGLKKDIPVPEDGGIPKCPNGHALTQGPGLRLGWLRDG